VGVRADIDLDLEHVAADDAARWVHEHVVAYRRCLGVQAAQHPQRAVVAVVGEGAVAGAAVVESQMAVPAHGHGVMRGGAV
jgi:hypothetical protein